MADAQKGNCTIILRAVTVSGAMLVPARLPYDLVERTVERILAATPTVRRVFYDQTPTPVGKETFQYRKSLRNGGASFYAFRHGCAVQSPEKT